MPVDDAAGARGAKSAEEDRSLGRKLEAARAGRGLSLEDIAAELRMEVRTVRALEECRFEDLGPPVFAKGYLKLYASRLDLDYKDLLADYYRLVEPRDITIAPSRTIRLRDERQITVWLIAAIALVLVGIFLWVWLGDLEPQPPVPAAASLPDAGLGETSAADASDERPDASSAGDADAPPASVSTARPGAAEPGLAEANAPASAEPNAVEPGPADASGAPAGTAGNEPTAEAAPRGAAAGDAGAAAAGSPSDLAAPAAPADAAGGAAAPTAGAVAVEIAFAEDSWTEVTGQGGERLYYGLGRRGGRARFRADLPVDVFLGNAAGVEITIDGTVFEVPPGARRGNLARFSIDAPTD